MQRVFDAWNMADGYLEKKDSSNLGDFTSAGKLVNAGDKNYTIIAKWYKEHTGNNYQGQPYCAMTVSEMHVMAYGLELARKLLRGELYSYCPTIYNVFKKSKAVFEIPEVGDIVLFWNSSMGRYAHVGQVSWVSNDRKSFKSNEGNTSSASGVIRNGGAIRCGKIYTVSSLPKVTFCRPDWSALQNETPIGWNYDKSEEKWWFHFGEGAYPKGDWYKAYCASDKKYHWFLFDKNGWMLTGYQEFKGKAYYLKETGELMGACMISDSQGVLSYMDAEV